MRFDDVAGIVDGIPHMTRRQGRVIYDHVVRTRPASVLELGFASGVSTCYIAAALEEVGDGSLVTVDRPDALTRPTTVHDLLERTGLGSRVEVRIDPVSYIWELKRMLELEIRPVFGFCFLDGAHTFDVDALAFLLADELIARDGWLLFDDLDWSLAASPSMSRLDWVRALPPERQRAHQIRSVVELLVSARGYDEVTEQDGWAWAHKVARPAGGMSAEQARAATAETGQLRAELLGERTAAATSRRDAALWRGRYERLSSRAPIRLAAAVAHRVRRTR